jgi:crossover junction endodeoxyribonuclease RuvC
LALYEGVRDVIEQWSPSAIAIEQLYAHYEHPRTAILMGHARGVFLLAGAQRGIPVLSYAATQVKKLITGHGRASKEQMQYTIMRELGLSAVPEPPDVADALAIALCHYYASGSILNGTRGATFMGVNKAMFEPQPDDVS